MGLEITTHLDIIELMENFIAQIRPPEHLQAQLDVSYKIDGQSVMIFEVRHLG